MSSSTSLLLALCNAPGLARSLAAHPGNLQDTEACRLACLEATVDELRVSVGTMLDFNAGVVRCYALSEQCALGLLGFGSTPMRIYSPPSHLGRSTGFTTAQALFYYAEKSADPDDPDDGHKFYMLCPGVWVLLKHGDHVCARCLSHDWNDCDFRPAAALARFVLEARHNDALRRSACWSDTVPPEAVVPPTLLAAPGMLFDAPPVAVVQPADTLSTLATGGLCCAL